MSCPFYAHVLIELRSMRVIAEETENPSPALLSHQWALVPDPTSNQCALITDAHSPCQMETWQNLQPDWRACERNPTTKPVPSKAPEKELK